MSTVNLYGRLLAMRSMAYSYIVDASNYKILYMNPPYLEKLGKKEGELTGTFCYETLFHEKEPCTFCPMKSMELEEKRSGYFYHETKNCHYMKYSFLTKKEETTCFVQTFVDISQEMEEIRQLKRALVEEELITACANTLQKGESAMDLLLELIGQFFQGEYGFILLKKKLPVGFRFDYIYSKSKGQEFFVDLKKRTFPIDEKSMEWETKLSKVQYIFLEGEAMNGLPDYVGAMEKPRENLLLVQLTLGEEVLGVMAIADIQEKKDYFSVISSIKPYISNSLFQRRRIRNLEEQNELGSMVLHCVETLEEKNNYEEAIAVFLATILEYFQGRKAYILKKEGDILIYQFNYKIGSGFLPCGHTSKLPSRAICKIFSEFGQGDSLFFSQKEDLLDRKEEISQELQLIGLGHLESFMGVRLYEEGEVRHFLLIDNPQAHREQVELLRGVSSFLESHLIRGKLMKQLEALSYADALTGLYNRNYYSHYLDYLSGKQTENLGIVFADVNGLKRANDNFGHELGDVLLKWSGNFIKKHLGDQVCRIGGDEYVAFVEEVTEEEFHFKIQNMNEEMKELGDVHISIGTAWVEEVDDIYALVKKVDENMYFEKKAYYQRKAFDTRSVKQELEDFKESLLSLQNLN